MKAEDFDNIIKDKIQQLNEGGNADMDWSSFEEKLDKIEALAPKDDTLFDAQLASKLTVVTDADKKGMDWSSFTNKLDSIPELNPEHDVFDTTVADKLTQLNFGYKTSDWENLSKRLDREGLLNNQIISIKSIELFIFVLLIWGIQGIYGPNFIPNNEILPIPKHENKKEKNPDKSSNDHTVIYADLNLKSNIKTSTKPPINTPPSLLQKSIAQTANNSNHSDDERHKSFDMSTVKSKTYPSIISTIEVNIDPLTISTDSRKITNRTNLTVKSIPNLMAILSIPSPLLPNTHIAIGDIKMDNMPAPKKSSNFRIGLEAIGKVSSVVSTTNTLGIDYIHHDLSRATGAGLVLDWRKGNLSFSTGLAFTKFTYYTAPLIIYSGSIDNNSTTLNNSVTMKMMRIPINLRIDLSSKNNWTAYGKAGMSIHFSVEKSSEIYGQEVINNNAQYTGLKTSETTSIFDSGNQLNENTFASIDLALGLERRINNTLSFYLEPSYEISLTSSNIKTTVARINSFCFRSGLYYNF